MRSTANIYTLSDAVSRSQKGLLFGSPGKLFPSRSRRHEHGHHQHAGDEPKAHEHHRNLPHARARVRGRQIAKVQRGWLTEAGAGAGDNDDLIRKSNFTPGEIGSDNRFAFR